MKSGSGARQTERVDKNRTAGRRNGNKRSRRMGRELIQSEVAEMEVLG